MIDKYTVLYHSNCYDGMASAWVIHKYLQSIDALDHSLFLALNYGDSVPEVTNSHVIMVDFSYKRPEMEAIIKDCRSIIILDHHKTAQYELEGLREDFPDKVEKIIFDMKRSGAGIAWDYYFDPTLRPDLVNYVEDRDLWRYNLPESREMNAFIQSFDINLDVWLNEFGVGNLTATDFLAGKALLRQQSKLVKEIAKHAIVAALPLPLNPGFIINSNIPNAGPIGISTYTSVLMSEVCEQMLADHPEMSLAFYMFFRPSDKKTVFGLRSRDGSDVDVSYIAKLYNGGGHKHAAGFTL